MKRLQALLAKEADTKYSATVHKYMKEIMPCRGLKMPVIQSIVQQWKLEKVVAVCSPSICARGLS